MRAAKVVPQSQATIVDFGVVEAGIKERETANVSRALAFAKLVTETIFNVPLDGVDEHIVDGGADRGIDIIYIDHDSRIVNIATCKTVINFKNSQKFFPGEEIDKVISFVDDLLYHREGLLENCNGSLAAKVREIWDIFSAEAYGVAVHLFSNKSTLPKDAKGRLIEALGRHNIPLFEYGLFELSHGLVKASKPRFKKTLSGNLDAVLSASNGARRSIVGKVALNDLAKFLTAPDGAFDERLVWQNVRYFLGIENEVNREIKSRAFSTYSGS